VVSLGAFSVRIIKKVIKLPKIKNMRKCPILGAFAYNFSWVGCSLLQAVQEKIKFTTSMLNILKGKC